MENCEENINNLIMQDQRLIKLKKKTDVLFKQV